MHSMLRIAASSTLPFICSVYTLETKGKHGLQAIRRAILLGRCLEGLLLDMAALKVTSGLCLRLLVMTILLDMAALKVTSALCLSLLVMTILLAPSCGNKEACDEWLSDTYLMLLLCSSKTCTKHCIDEGATRGKCGFLIFKSFCFCTKECD